MALTALLARAKVTRSRGSIVELVEILVSRMAG
jgi:hypothetical protein